MYKQVMLIILSFSLIFLLLFSGCQPSTIPDLTTGTISGQVALPGSYFKDITGYTSIPGATVSIIDSEGNIHTTLTDENGFYSFDNITVKANTIINIEKDTEGGGKIVFREVITQAEAIADYIANPPAPAPLPSPATTPIRYVATDGDNANDGSESAPWKIIQYALTTIPASGIVLIKDGFYKESINFPSDKVIILKSTKGDSCTIIQGNDGSATVTC